MKKLLFCLCILAGIVLISCSQNDDYTPNNESSPLEKESEILQQLTLLNDSVRLSFGIASNESKSRGIKDNIVSQSDVRGSYYGSKFGGTIGRAIGTLFGSASKGEEKGAKIGGDLIGAAASLVAALIIDDGCLVHAPDINIMKIAYCQVENDIYRDNESGGETDVAYVDILDLPDGLGSIENIGRIHNGMLDWLSMHDISGGVMPYTLIDNDFVGVELVDLSPMEAAIVDSEEFVECYNEVAESILAGDFGMDSFIDGELTIADEVMKLYLEAMGNFPANGALLELISLTNQYIALVAASDDMGDDEKQNLYEAFSVGVYSYMYWSTHE